MEVGLLRVDLLRLRLEVVVDKEFFLAESFFKFEKEENRFFFSLMVMEEESSLSRGAKGRDSLQQFEEEGATGLQGKASLATGGQ